MRTVGSGTVMTQVEIVEAEGEAARGQAFEVRRLVFVVEQGVPAAFEFDEADRTSSHLLARVDGRPVGTLRLRWPSAGIAKIERVAVLPEARGLKIGRRLVQAALGLARERGCEAALLHAQVRVRRFYEELGFEAVGDTFIEDGILHMAMRRGLAERGEAAA
jgi:predicted GNAT family N-acyltransferase